jgi:NAD(P)-dependent dehydrogenase (short-subunit alcohol dehydrogenase family)
MDLKMRGRTALVTGSAAGIGFAIAKALAEEGASVIVNGRSDASVRDAIERIRKAVSSAKVEGLAVDAATAAGADALHRRWPKVDILVNNLGIYAPKPYFEIGDDEWLRYFDVNVVSGIRLSRLYGQGMAQRGWGRILFISSESAINIPREMIHYGVTKTAQLALARGLAETTAGTAVTVNSVLPGPTGSEGVVQFLADLARTRGKTAAEMEEDFFRTARPTSLLRRFEAPEEIASLVTYLCSPLASGTNGAAVRVDGGVVRSII